MLRSRAVPVAAAFFSSIILIPSNMKKLLFIAAILVAAANISFAQIKSAQLTASGLTCSMCSKSILKALEKVDFVQAVQADIATSSYTITFRNGTAINPDALKTAVERAGFSVASLKVTATVPAITVSNDAHLALGGLNLHFLNVPEKSISGEQTFTLLDKGFLPAKDYKRNGSFTKMPCYHTGMMAPCCAKAAGLPAGRIYHVTLS